jgi:predicted amidohydrolase YtcJ
MITVYSARRIHTMDPNRPEATHVAVRNGLIIAVGGPDCADGWGASEHDDRFADKIMLPGLIEAHAHASAGGIWRATYCGHYARTDPKAQVWDGIDSAEALVERLIAAAGSEGPIIGWGFDPNFVAGPRLTRIELDQVSQDRPVVVLHSNFHLLTCNSAALAMAGITEGSNVEGVMREPDGKPNGELQEFAAMGPVMKGVGIDFSDFTNNADSIRTYGQVARLCGVTTVADMLSDLHEDEVEMLLQVTGDPAFPVRYVPVMNAMVGEPKAEAARAVALCARSTDRLRLGRAKLFTDGAIQGFTAKLEAPGYYRGDDHGIWNMGEDHFRAAVMALHVAGVKTHIHTNGDAASKFAMDAIEAAMLAHPAIGLRHTLEHVQLADAAQFRRMKALGISANLFANHLYYFGDVHLTRTLGPDRATRMDACRDALETFGEGQFAIHSDAPVTPMAPLFTAWCAVNRLTATGRSMGEYQRISVETALRAITLGAAHVLKLDDEIGSIRCGKRADFCLLNDDPLAVDPVHLKDVPVAATVLAGKPTCRAPDLHSA